MSCFLLPFCISPHDEHRSSGPRPVKLFGPVNISVFISRTAVLQKTSVSISFTVHKSGTYKIHVMVNGKHIKGSPFIKAFEAGNSREVLVMLIRYKLVAIPQQVSNNKMKCEK
jgi:hypothetical protein